MPFIPEGFRNEPFTDFSKPENQEKMRKAFEKVEKELGKEYPLAIGGEEIYRDEKFQSINPGDTRQTIGTFQVASLEDVDKAVRTAYSSFKSWAKLSPYERANTMLRAAEIMRQRRYELVAWMVLEVGKNWAEADADVAEAIDYFEYYARLMKAMVDQKPKLVEYPKETNEYRYLPLGVVVVIPPWNFPLAIPTGMTVGALVTGNTVVLKPASDAPMMGWLLYQILREAGVPEGVINYVTGPGPKVGTPLVQHPLTRMLAYTGSKKVGIILYEEASKVREGQKWLKRAITEMGGKDAIIIDSSAELEKAVKATVVSAFGFQGQKCSAASRLIVLEDVYDKVLEMLKEETEKIEVGLPKENYFMGPVINKKAEDKIMKYIEIGKSGEGRLITGGEKVDVGYPGYYIRPTVFADVDPKARIATEEIFGPVLAVIKAKDFDQALEIANDTEYGLTGAVFATDRYKIEKAKDEFFVGNLYINRKCTGAIVGVHPFGGFNMSGTDNKAGGPEYLLYFTQAKAISEKLD